MLAKANNARTKRDSSLSSLLGIPRYYFEVDGWRSETTWDEKTYSTQLKTQKHIPVLMGKIREKKWWLYQNEFYVEDMGYTAEQITKVIDRDRIDQASFVPPAAKSRIAAPFVTRRDLSKPSARPVSSPSPPPLSAPVIQREWCLPDTNQILEQSGETEINEQEIRKRAHIIEETLSNFAVPAKVLEVNQGPWLTQFGIEPGFTEHKDATGKLHRTKVSVNQISSLQHDLELVLAVAPIRITTPIPGRNVIGIEVPNLQIATVSFRSVIESERFKQVKAKSKLALALGQDISGQAVVADLATMPHLLIAGATGSGKSICIHSIIACLLCTLTPDEVRLVMIDPKRVELVNYNGIPHLIRPVATEVNSTVSALKEVVSEMDRRLGLFAPHGVRDFESYNQVFNEKEGREKLLRIVVIIDEPTALITEVPDDMNKAITRIAQIGRSSGIHLIVATQRPSVDIVAGLIKSNLLSRISFQVTSQIDSLIVLDMPGAEALRGHGRMLYLPTESHSPVEIQGCFISNNEIERISERWKGFLPPTFPSTLSENKAPLVENTFLKDANGKKTESDDDLLPQAMDVVKQSQRASVSLLQRKLRIGYSRATRLMELLEQRGVVGPDGGPTKGRAVLAREITPLRQDTHDFKEDDFENFTDEDWDNLDT